MRDLERLHQHILRAVAVGGLLAACTGETPKSGEASAGDAKPVEKTKEQGRIEPVGVQTELDDDGGGSRRGCGDPTLWCGAKEAVAKITVTKKPTSLGCPAEIAGQELVGLESAPEYVGLSSTFTAKVDEPATANKRAEADEDTCCYAWRAPCRGRPLRDEGVSLLASVASGSSWHDQSISIDVPDGTRARLAAVWIDDALAEHASIASFARAVLELLAVGAPSDLVAATTRAAADEVEHARLCFGIASALDGRSLGPGPLPAAPPRAAELARLAVDTFIEGCVEETAAALEARRAAACCTSPSIRAALLRIADDEADHAALAWRTVAWAVARGGRSIAERLLAVPLPLAPMRDDTVHDADVLHAAGRLTAAERAEARRDAIRHIVAPMLSRLAGSA